MNKENKEKGSLLVNLVFYSSLILSIGSFFATLINFDFFPLFTLALFLMFALLVLKVKVLRK